ncbi:HAMP domain-containing protein, partial [Treponema pedis]|uniref:HAMP domain-containing protein n=1 Tax=Treponema pedis TaxID=409322 RepID=UPI003D1E18FF
MKKLKNMLPPPPPPKNLESSRHRFVKSKKRFSIRNRMVLIFSILFVAGLSLSAFITISRARTVVKKRVRAHLTDKAADTAAIIDGYIQQWFEYLDGIAMLPVLHDKKVSYLEKAVLLKTMADNEESLMKLEITDTDGLWYLADGRTFDCSKQGWYLDTDRGKNRVYSEPMIDLDTGKMIITMAVPIYGENNVVADILLAAIDGYELSKDVQDIKVGERGNCFIVGKTGVNIANKNRELVTQMFNPIEDAKINKKHTEVAAFIEKALKTHTAQIGDYDFMGTHNIAASAIIETTGWNVFIEAPVEDFLGDIDTLRTVIIIINIVISCIVLVLVYFTAVKIVTPIKNTVDALQNIAEGDGDLTVRLPVTGNDEITDM